MAKNPKPLRAKPKYANRILKEYPKAEREAFKKDYLEKVKRLVPGAVVKSCGGIGTILSRGEPYIPHYMMFGKYYPEYDLEVMFEDDSRVSMHGLLDCSELPPPGHTPIDIDVAWAHYNKVMAAWEVLEKTEPDSPEEKIALDEYERVYNVSPYPRRDRSSSTEVGNHERGQEGNQVS